MTSQKKTAKIKFYADGAYHTYVGRLVYSDAGRGPGPAYSVRYQLTDGRTLRGTRHTDRGDLLTDLAWR